MSRIRPPPTSRFDELLGPDFLDGVPRAPGVYEWLDAAGATVYVGKAVDLRRRLAQYRTATRRKATRKRWEIVRAGTRLRFQACATDLDALLLENELIQRLRPPLNVAGAFAFLYPCIGVRRGAGGLDLVCTTSPAGFPGFVFTGAFRSASATRDAFASLVELLTHLGHLEPSRRGEGRTEGAVLARRPLPEDRPSWDALLLRLLRGEGRTAIRPLTLALLERPAARRHAAETQDHLERLTRFSDEECEPLRAVLTALGAPDGFLPQESETAPS